MGARVTSCACLAIASRPKASQRGRKHKRTSVHVFFEVSYRGCLHALPVPSLCPAVKKCVCIFQCIERSRRSCRWWMGCLRGNLGVASSKGGCGADGVRGRGNVQCATSRHVFPRVLLVPPFVRAWWMHPHLSLAIGMVKADNGAVGAARFDVKIWRYVVDERERRERLALVLSVGIHTGWAHRGVWLLYISSDERYRHFLV